MGLTIGLTGGIASGKSTVSNMLKEYGFSIIDADVIAREVVEKGKPAYLKIVEEFGEGILQADGIIDRLKLGSMIFQDVEKREILNSIIHPFIRKSMMEQREFYINQDKGTIIMDIPLLFESKLTYMVDKTIVVYVDFDVQLKRLMDRNSFSEEEARERINSQMPLQKKRDLADEVIDNNGTINETRDQLLRIMESLDLN